MAPKAILIIAPHPDDAELGCGGYMHREAAAGAEIRVVTVTSGGKWFKHLKRSVSSDERKEEERNAQTVLGVRSRQCFDLPDGNLYDSYALRSKLEDALDHFEPDELLIPLPSSHQDHVAIYDACITACRPSANRPMQLIAAYEYGASNWGPGGDFNPSRGGLYAKLSQHDMDKKIEALSCYKSQVREDGHPWSLEAARAWGKVRGLECNAPYAELFYILREVR